MYLRASLVVQRLKRLPAMWETWVRSLGREDPLEKEMATHSSVLAWRVSWTEKLVGYSPRVTKSRTRLSDFTFTLRGLNQTTGPVFVIQPFPGGSVVKNPPADTGDTSSIPGLGKSPGVENGTPVFLPGKCHGLRSLGGYSPWGLRAGHE